MAVDYQGSVATSEDAPTKVTVLNKTGATLSAGKVVYISGAQGNRVTVALAKADSPSTSEETLGVVESDIANNATGLVVTTGEITGLNTNSFTVGDSLYVSATTAGELVATAPTGINQEVHVGHVLVKNPTLGAILLDVIWHEHEHTDGTEFPTNTRTGHRHQFTGSNRTVEYLYDGSNWLPVANLANLTIYVDKTNGTDSPGKGDGTTTDAYATIDYAWSQIPHDGNGFTATINITAETYNEDLLWTGKDNYTTITIRGTLALQVTQAQTSSVQGVTSTPGSISDTVNDVSGYEDMLLYSSNNEEYRHIHIATADKMTAVHTWTALPLGNYSVYDWGTVIAGTGGGNISLELSAQRNIIFEDIEFQTSNTYWSARIWNFSKADFYRCKFEKGVTVNNLSACDFHECNSIHDGDWGWYFSFQSTGNLYGCKVDGNLTQGVYALQSSAIAIRSGTVIDGNASGATGVHVATRSHVTFLQYSRIYNWTTGVLCVVGSATGTATNVYSDGGGNATDENPTPSTDPAYID